MKTIFNKLVVLGALAGVAASLSGCFPLAAGGALMTGFVVTDRRTSGALVEDQLVFKRMLDSFSIDLIADHVESEPMLLELLDMHLDYGQGYLFGEPRIARAETSALH